MRNVLIKKNKIELFSLFRIVIKMEIEMSSFVSYPDIFKGFMFRFYNNLHLKRSDKIKST